MNLPEEFVEDLGGQVGRVTTGWLAPPQLHPHRLRVELLSTPGRQEVI